MAERFQERSWDPWERSERESLFGDASRGFQGSRYPTYGSYLSPRFGSPFSHPGSFVQQPFATEINPFGYSQPYPYQPFTAPAQPFPPQQTFGAVPQPVGQFPVNPFLNPYLQAQSMVPIPQIFPQISQTAAHVPPLSYLHPLQVQSLLQNQMIPQPGRRNFTNRPPRGYRRPDERIREEVVERLTVDPYVDATNLEIIVKDGEVTLRGAVEDREQKRYAEDIAECVFGVRDIQNQIRVEPEWVQYQQTGRATEKEGELVGAGRGKEK